MIVAAYERHEFGVDGQRRYITSSAQEFFFYYFQLPANQRTHYEVIPSDKACKLYFDLEFDVSCNPETEGPKLVETFIDVINASLAHFGFEQGHETSILNLDSSSPTKFSCHLIFTETVFRSNGDIGNFLRAVFSELNNACKLISDNDRHMKEGEPVEIFDRSFVFKDLKDLYVNSKDETEKQLFVDSAVYSKNRNFRMYKSSKLGKNKFLNRANSCKYFPEIRDSDSNFQKQLKPTNLDANVDINPELYRTFLDSLITNIDFAPKETVSFETQTSLRTEMFDNPKACNKAIISEVPKPTKAVKYFMYSGIEDLIISTLTKQMKLANVRVNENDISFRTCKNLESNNLVLYELDHNYRYCERIRRFHKSNKVYICVDLSKLVFYQKCFDPDCAGFRGNEFPIPQELVAELYFDDDWGYS